MENIIEIPEGYDARIESNKVIIEPKDSEDERIRKAIIEFFQTEDDNTTYSFVKKADILAWLEKQGSQNLANSAKTCKDLQEPVSKKSNPLFDECVANVPDWVMKETSDKMDAMIAEEDLEKEIARYEESIYGFESSSRDDCIGIAKHFAEYGARMQKEQMMKDALPAVVKEGKRVKNTYVITSYVLFDGKYTKDSRIKMIVIPSDNKND